MFYFEHPSKQLLQLPHAATKLSQPHGSDENSMKGRAATAAPLNNPSIP